MTKVVFLYSGEGTSDRESDYKLLRYAHQWSEIERILKTRLDLDVEALWKQEIGRHRCPHSPVLTLVAQICLADIWKRWGYAPDVVIGHSIGELAAAYQAGLYSLEEILLLAHQIGQITARLDGAMLHGKLSDEQIAGLPVHISSLNFTEGEQKHITVSGYADEMSAFHDTHPDFTGMRLPHPWHHPDYGKYGTALTVAVSRPVADVGYVSGVSGHFEQRLGTDYWRRWLTHTVDFIGAMRSLKDHLGDDEPIIIEIGFHPVLQRCCEVFKRCTYASSMFRGEDEIQWVLHQRRQMAPERFRKVVRQRVREFDGSLDLDTSLAYQGFTSITFVEFTNHIEDLFPSLAPQDFYRFKSVNQLIRGFGAVPDEKQSAAVSAPRKQEVVIAGMSCRFPAAVETLPQFWQMLLSREDPVNNIAGRADFAAGFLHDSVTRFDHKYFGIAENEALAMDPQQALALELAEMLWRDAGIDPQRLDRKRVGVYIGAWNVEFAGNSASVYYPTGANPSIIAGRISYHYDLRGPSWVSNTACSSSLVAVHYAAKDIEAGRVDFAIAGGVNMILGRRFTAAMRHSGFLSKDDRCKAFDDDADGYVRAEGGGLVLLANRRMVDAFYATLSGSAINQNGGRAQVITAPHPQAQEEVIAEACREAAIAPREIAYVECHGTGTRIGDPIEVSALQNTVARARNNICYLGSVKSNLGHLESAAGMAGLLKAVLALYYGKIPPNLHFNRPNQFIDFDNHRLRVVTRETPIDPQAYIGISSFGFGGSNAHVVVKGAAPAVKKTLASVEIPFDRDAALPLARFYPPDDAPAPQEPSATASETIPAIPGGDIRATVQTIFFNLTGIETIDPELALFEQGLDSMSAAEFVNLLEQQLTIELDPDLLFDHPLVEQLVAVLEQKIEPAADDISADNPDQPRREDIAATINDLFFKLTNIDKIDPQIALTEQGLDSMSVTELIAQLEVVLTIDLDPDVVFEYPLFDQLVDAIYALAQSTRTIAN